MRERFYSTTSVARLQSVNESKWVNDVNVGSVNQAYTYDRWGNRQINYNNTSSTLNRLQFDVNPSTENNNRIYAPNDPNRNLMSYDQAGNLKNDAYSSYGSTTGQQTRFYDAENRLIQAKDYTGGWSYYTYDGDGKRTRRKFSSTETWQVYGMDGELLAEYAPNALPAATQKEYGYRNGQLLVTAEGGTGPQKIVFASVRNGNSEIYIMNPDGSSQTRLTNNTASDIRPSLSPGGSKIAFASNRDGNYEVYVMNVDGTGQTRLTNAVGDDAEPAWSPNGTKIAFSTQRDGSYEIYKMNADGSNQVKVTNTSIIEKTPDWSPDGTKIAFQRWENNNYVIYTINVDGTNEVRLTNNTKDFSPEWSPNGAKIVFGSNRDNTGYPEVYVMNADGSGQTRLTNNTTTDLNPSWSPDGAKIVFSTQRDGNDEIYVMNADGSAQTRITNVTAADTEPDWGQSVGAGIQWLVSDQLGTPRMIFDKTGSLANTKRHDYLPFGEELFATQNGRTTTQGYSGDNVRQKFTQKERDNETGLDFFEARYYASTPGRFTSVDPYNIVMEVQNTTDAENAQSQFITYLSNPQRWARYTYALNNPLLYTDPHGEDVTIYYRPPKEGAGISQDQGHILIYVRNDETGESAYYDYINMGEYNNLGETR